MRVSRSLLHGRGGWSTVAGLGAALVVLVAGQLPATAGAALQPAPVVAVPHVVAETSAGDRLPRRVAAVAPAARPVRARAVPRASLCDGPGWQARRGQAALSSLRGGAARTGFRVEFAPARKGYLGLTHLEERRIEVFVRPCGTQSDELLRHVVAHELGHAYDTTQMTTATRRAWQAARGIPAGADWYGCSGCTDFATPAGDFAEVYAQWARGASTNRSELAGDVAPARLAEFAARFFGA